MCLANISLGVDAISFNKKTKLLNINIRINLHKIKSYHDTKSLPLILSNNFPNNS